MHYLLIHDDAPRADLEQAMSQLRAKQRACRVGQIRDELGEDIDELLEMWARA